MMKDLQGKIIGIIGFNARPIACSARNAGGDVFVSDYWGDDDLSTCCDQFVAILTNTPGYRQRGSLENPVHETLVDNFITEYSEIDFDEIIIGSGFDDKAKSLMPVEKQWGISGNSIEQMEKARDRKFLQNTCQENGISFPRSSFISMSQTIRKEMNVFGYPVLLREMHSGGGGNIRLHINWESLSKDIARRRKKPRDLLLQEYVRGIDLSTSTLSSAERAKCISVQNQLIGLPIAGRNCDFAYCGNSFPAFVNQAIRAKLEHISTSIIEEIGLVGSNGIDFVVGNEKIWLLEINPRIQGTLELIEIASRKSMLVQHLESLNGDLPRKRTKYHIAMKLIVYARKQGIVPNLSRFSNTRDRSPEGVLVNRGDPITTILVSGGTQHDVASEVYSTALQIQNII